MPDSDDELLRKWDEVRARLHESGHRFNARCAEMRYAGKNIDPQAVLQYITKNYETTAAITVKVVTDHESALHFVQELDLYLKNLLKVALKLFREVLPRENRGSSSAYLSELQKRLLPRSEHWKAEAHRVARSAARARVRNAKSAVSVQESGDRRDYASSKGEQPESDGQRILRRALEQQGLTAPELARKIQKILKIRKDAKPKADRTTIYRILKRETKRPRPAMRNAFLEALQLEGKDAEIVWRDLGGVGRAPTVWQNSKKVDPLVSMH